MSGIDQKKKLCTQVLKAMQGIRSAHDYTRYEECHGSSTKLGSSIAYFPHALMTARKIAMKRFPDTDAVLDHLLSTSLYGVGRCGEFAVRAMFELRKIDTDYHHALVYLTHSDEPEKRIENHAIVFLHDADTDFSPLGEAFTSGDSLGKTGDLSKIKDLYAFDPYLRVHGSIVDVLNHPFNGGKYQHIVSIGDYIPKEVKPEMLDQAFQMIKHEMETGYPSENRTLSKSLHHIKNDPTAKMLREKFDYSDELNIKPSKAFTIPDPDGSLAFFLFSEKLGTSTKPTKRLIFDINGTS